MMKTLQLTGHKLTLENIEEVARFFRKVSLSKEAVEKVAFSRAVVEKLSRKKEKLFYGINTGFGALCNVRISEKFIEDLQTNIIKSHAAGVGELLPEEVVRAMMLIRVNSLIQGNSGIRLETIHLLIAFLNKKIHPCVPSQGSVGASGDLAPLAHMCLPLIGDGDVFYKGKKYPSKTILKRCGLKPVLLKSKEGLALINGTAMMSAFGALALLDAERLVKMADISGSMSLEALKGTHAFLRKEIHALRPHPGQGDSAANMRKILAGSGILEKYRDMCKVQDAYSVRCIPQVHGASKDVLKYVRSVLAVEVNSVTDNPIVLPETDEILSGGNFHGQPLAFAMDFLAIAMAEVANIAEARVSRLINSRYSDLPPFLVENSGLNSGFMVAQYTMAALVSENKVLCHPASVDSIPTCAGQEDHVSMGSIAARKARTVLNNVSNVIAIEFLAATQGLDFLAPFKSSEPIEAVRSLIRSQVPKLIKDRRIDLDIAKIAGLMHRSEIIKKTEKLCGKLK